MEYGNCPENEKITIFYDIQQFYEQISSTIDLKLLFQSEYKIKN